MVSRLASSLAMMMVNNSTLMPLQHANNKYFTQVFTMDGSAKKLNFKIQM